MALNPAGLVQKEDPLVIRRRYSIVWARGVVDRLTEKYPRATDLAKEVWGVTDTNLAAYLSCDAVFWKVFRYTWKNIQRQIDGRGGENPATAAFWIDSLLSSLLSSYGPEIPELCREKYVLVLTARKIALKIEEQGLRQGREVEGER